MATDAGSVCSAPGPVILLLGESELPFELFAGEDLFRRITAFQVQVAAGLELVNAERGPNRAKSAGG